MKISTFFILGMVSITVVGFLLPYPAFSWQYFLYFFIAWTLLEKYTTYLVKAHTPKKVKENANPEQNEQNEENE